jgi:hypothetical protein
VGVTDTNPAPASEYVTFIQHQLPGLEAGGYQLDISQRVDDSQGQPISDDTLSRRYTFVVAGDRFRLSDPSAAIASTFPASNATGEFTTTLPHVVFAAPSFPWIRTPVKSQPALPAPGADSKTDVPTWLAVLVLDDDDTVPFPGFTLEPVTMVVGDLFPPAVYQPSTLGGNVSYFTGAKDTTGLGADGTTADPVQVIDIPLKLFADIAPTLADLTLSAHVRRLSVENKPAALGAAPPADPIGSFAIVVANRLPQADKQSHAYLVSLESLQDFLPATSEGGTLADPSLDLNLWLRLTVLTHWTFNTKKDTAAAFVDQLELLNDRTIGGPDASNTNLRLAVPGANPPVSTALAAGYVPLDHDLRTGETTVSWYRGPLSTVDRARSPLPLPVSSPDQALAFDPTTGMFDASLAAAWTIGRLVALQDQSYASALYTWKKGLTRAVVNAVEDEIVNEALGGLLAQAAPRALTEQAPPGQAPPGHAAVQARPSAKSLLHETMRLISSAGAQ